MTIGGDRTTLFKSNESHTVNGFLSTTVGVNETRAVGAFRNTTIGANDDLHVAAWHNTTVGAGETITVSGPRDIVVTGTQTSKANGDFVFKSTNAYVYPAGDFQVVSTSAGFTQSSSFSVHAGGCTLEMKAGKVILTNGAGAKLALIGGILHVDGVNVVIKGSSIDMHGSGRINATAPAIKLNG